MSPLALRSIQLAIVHLSVAVLGSALLADSRDVAMETIVWAAAHAQVLLVAVWAAFGRAPFPLRWAALAICAVGWSATLATPMSGWQPMLVLGTESLAALAALYAARALGVELRWLPATGTPADAQSGQRPRFGIRDFLAAMVVAAVLFAGLRIEAGRGVGGVGLDAADVFHLALFRAAYVAFALIVTWVALGTAPVLRRTAWLATFLALWMGLTVSVLPPAAERPILFSAQRLIVTVLFGGTLLLLRSVGLRWVREAA